MSRLAIVAFDADDTLWQNERHFAFAQDRFRELLADHAEPDHLDERLLAAERRNLGAYGYGVKGFVLSMIETALEVTEERAPGHVIAALTALGRDMLAHPVELLAGAESAVAAAAEGRRVLLVTKGDLLDQERKLAQSGLGDLFDGVHIVSEKDRATYAGLFGGDADRAAMIGNSLKSDVNPALAAGAHGLWVPSEIVWALEHDDEPEGHPRYRRLESLSQVPERIEAIEAGAAMSL